MANILKTIAHGAKVLRGRLRERKKERERSPRWASVRDAFVEKNPVCAACGGVTELQVHHRKPFHEFPDLELEEANLIVLCMGPYECHLRVGHGGDYKFYNPNVGGDAAWVRLEPTSRADVEGRAKTARLGNHG